MKKLKPLKPELVTVVQTCLYHLWYSGKACICVKLIGDTVRLKIRLENQITVNKIKAKHYPDERKELLAENKELRKRLKAF